MYMVDWEWNGQRSQRVEVLDSEGRVLDTRTVETFQNGQYLVWNLAGRVQLRVTNLNTGSNANATVSGLFFGPGGAAPAPTGQPAGTWVNVEGVLAQIAAGSDGTVVGANGNSELFRRTFVGWEPVPGRAQQIVAVSATRWFANTETALFLNDGTGWAAIPMPAGVTRLAWIAAAADGTLLGIDMEGRVHQREAQTAAWTVVASNASRVAIRNRVEFYLLRPDQTIWRHFSGTSAQLPGLLTDISVSTAGDVWGVSQSQEIWQWNGVDWTKVPGLLVQIAVGNPHTIWGITASGTIFRRQ